MADHRLRLMFEWGGGCLWAGNRATMDALDIGPLEDRLPLPPALRARLDAMSAEHDGALDWADPAGPSPWSAAQIADFHGRAMALRTELARALGPGFTVDYTADH